MIKPTLAAATLLGALSTATSPLPAQEQIITDRPDFTESPNSIDPGRVQIETGLTHTEMGEVSETSFGEILVRIGWTDALELRLGINSYTTLDGPGEVDSGFEDASVGIKLELRRPTDGDKKSLPGIALLAVTTLPTGTTDSSQSGLQPTLILAFGWSLNETLSLGINFGASYLSAGDESFYEGSGSISLGIGLSEAWSAYVEYYGLLPEGTSSASRHFGNTGVTYLISDDFQLDIRVGTALSGDDTDLFVGVGLGYRW